MVVLGRAEEQLAHPFVLCVADADVGPVEDAGEPVLHEMRTVVPWIQPIIPVDLIFHLHT